MFQEAANASTIRKSKLGLLALFAVLGTWHTFVCLVACTSAVVYVTTHVYGPTLAKPVKEPRGKILEDCPLSTNNADDLVVLPYQSEADAFHIMDDHGVAIIPKILSQTTTERFLKFVEEANPEMRQVSVAKKENRFRIMPSPFEEAIVGDVMREIGTHRTLKPLVDNVLGPSASLVSFSVITAGYGAEAQNWHRDTIKSGMTHPDDFVHELTLTIPLQDTTREMGATGICPGTHRCYWVDGHTEKTSRKYGLPCNVTASIGAGDSLIYHTDTIHRGGTHVDPDAPDRSVLFVTFAESKVPNQKKRLAHGKIYSLDWRMWGLTIDDFPHLRNMQWKWSYLHPTGWRFFRGNGKTERNPWCAVDAFLKIYDRPQFDTCYFLSNTFNSKQADEMSAVMLYGAVGVVSLYAWIGVPLWVYALAKYFSLRKLDTISW